MAPKKNGLVKAQESLLKQMLELNRKCKELEIITNRLQILYDNLAAKQIEQRVIEIKIIAFQSVFSKIVILFARNSRVKLSQPS